METRTYTERSNARRAARAAGIDPNLVYEIEDGFTFPHNGSELAGPPRIIGHYNTPESPARIVGTLAGHETPDLDIPAELRRPAPTADEMKALTAKARRENSPEKEIIVRKEIPKRAAAKGGKKESKARGGDKTTTLLKMLSGKGSTVDQLTEALGWLPHTLRARLSRLNKPKSKGGEGIKIERSRTDKVTTYRIAA